MFPEFKKQAGEYNAKMTSRILQLIDTSIDRDRYLVQFAS